MRLRTKRQSASIQGETPAYFQDYATLRRYLLGDSSGGRDILEQMMQEAVAENQGPTNDDRAAMWPPRGSLGNPESVEKMRNLNLIFYPPR